MAPLSPHKGMFKRARRALRAFELDQEERCANIRLTHGEAAKLLATYADPADRAAILAKPLDADDMHVACELATMREDNERERSLIATKEVVQLRTERVSRARQSAAVKRWMRYDADYAKRMKEELETKEAKAARLAAEEELREKRAAERRRVLEAEIRRRDAEERRRREEARRKEEERQQEAEEEDRRRAHKLWEEVKAREAAEVQRAEDARRAATRRAQEALAAEMARRAEAARREEMIRRAKEARRMEEARRAAEEARRAEQQARRAAEEARRAQEDRRANQHYHAGYQGQDVGNEPHPAAEQPQRENGVAEQLAGVLELYDQKWEALKSTAELPPIPGEQMPWPVFHQVYMPEHITYEAVKEFVLHPLRTKAGGNLRKKVMAELLRWHSDKFDGTALNKIQADHREVAKECAGLVERWLTRLLAEL